MLGLGLPERTGRLDRGDGLARPEAGGIHIGDRVARDALLLRTQREDRGTVARADVVALTIQVDGSWIWKKNARMSRYVVWVGSNTISTASAWPGWLR